MMLPIYQYTLQVGATAVTPQGPLPCGTAGDHLAARLIFAFEASAARPEDYAYRLEIVCGDGTYDLTEPQEVEAGGVSWDIPTAWTAAGTATVRLVQVELAADGTETRCRHFSPVLLQFDRRDEGGGTVSAAPRWQALLSRGECLLDELGHSRQRLLTLSQSAVESAAAAAAQSEQAATAAAAAAAHSQTAATAAQAAEPYAHRAEEAAVSACEDAETCDALLHRCEELCGTVDDIAALAGEDSGVAFPCVTVDTALAADSANPVANAAVTAAVNKLTAAAENTAEALNGKAGVSHLHDTDAVRCRNSGYWWGTSDTAEDALMGISRSLASLHSGLDGVSGSLAAERISTAQQGGTVEESLAGLWATKVSTSSLTAETVPFAYSGAPSVSTVADALKLLFGQVGL